MITNNVNLLLFSNKSSTFAQKLECDMKNIREYWKNTSKIGRAFFWILLVIGMGLIICSFFLPPAGEIHPSVLKSFGLVQSFASIGWGLELFAMGKNNVEVSKGDMSVKVTKAPK